VGRARSGTTVGQRRTWRRSRVAPAHQHQQAAWSGAEERQEGTGRGEEEADT